MQVFDDVLVDRNSDPENMLLEWERILGLRSFL